MTLILKNVNYFRDGAFHFGDYPLNLRNVSDSISVGNGGFVSDFNNCFIFPAFCDVHVHLREPGFSYKETIASGTEAAAHGGYTDICSMPNLNPVPDCVENLSVQERLISEQAFIRVHPYGSITAGEKGEKLSDMEDMSARVAGFSDDGRGVQNGELMRRAMLAAKKAGKIIVAHCEDNSLLNGGYIHDGEYAQIHGHKGICSKSEWLPIKRDIELVRETGCKYHVCHISCRESVDIIRAAKAEGLDVSCETAPHYLLFNDMDLEEDGRFKMNPPIRSESDRLSLIAGLIDGTIDMIATDHAPHSANEKSRGLKDSLMGISGIETAFSALYTGLVKKNIISLEKLIQLMSVNPRRRFGLPAGDDICIFDLDSSYTVDPDSFLSKGHSTPFAGKEMDGTCRLTVCGGNIVYSLL